MYATQLRPRLIERDGREGLPPGFAELPHVVYARDPLWIPEEPEELERLFQSSNPWFEDGTARLFCLPGRVRAAVFRNGHMSVNGQTAGFFGYWESTGDPDGEALVMHDMESWACNSGAHVLVGPVNFSTFGTYRLRLSASAEAVPFAGEPYNPATYPAALEALGFTIIKRYLSQEGPFPRVRWDVNRDAYLALLEEGYSFHPLTSQLWMERLPELHGLVDSSFASNLGYTPISLERFTRECGERFIAKSCPFASTLAMGPEGDIAGFLLVFPHYGPLLIQRAGSCRVSPRKLNYDEHMPLLASHGPVQAIAKTVGVSPRHRRKGVMNALVVAMCERGAADRYDRWLTALIREDNYSRRFGEGHAASERWYALYGKVLDR